VNADPGQDRNEESGRAVDVSMTTWGFIGSGTSAPPSVDAERAAASQRQHNPRHAPITTTTTTTTTTRIEQP